MHATFKYPGKTIFGYVTILASPAGYNETVHVASRRIYALQDFGKIYSNDAGHINLLSGTERLVGCQ